MSLLNTWQFNLFGYLVSVVAFYQFYKLAVRNALKDGAATVTLQVLAGLSVLILAPVFAFKFPSDIKYYLLLIGACIFYALSDRLQTTARKHLQVSVFTIINQLNTVFLFIYGLTLFREPFVLNKFLGVLLILAANMLLRYAKGKIEINRYVVIAIVAAFAFATAVSVDINIAKVFNLPFYIMLTLLIPAGFVFVADRIKISDIKKELNGKDKRFYLLTGIFWALTIFFSLRSFQLGSVTKIVPLQATNILLNVIIAYFILGERKDEVKKIIAALLVIGGICLTVL